MFRLRRLDWLTQFAFTTVRLFLKNGLANHAAATAFYCLLRGYALEWLGALARNSAPATIPMAALYEQLQPDRLIALSFIPREARAASALSP